MLFWDHLDEEDHVTNRFILLSCDPGRREWNHPFGQLWIYSTETGSLSPPARPSNLFLVNHARENSTIEQFVLDPAQPLWRPTFRTLTSSYFVAPNSLTRWLIEHKFAALGIAFANGVALSRDGLRLAVASSSMAKVHFYKRDPSTDDLTPDRDVIVPFGPDNVMYDDDDTLIVAGHPHFPSFVAVVGTSLVPKCRAGPFLSAPLQRTRTGSRRTGYDSRAPLSASAIAPASSTDEVETIFQSDGSVYGTATTGLIDSRTGAFYLTGLYEDGVLVCYPEPRSI
ncbi:hypothetical protein EDD16DRAFT_1683384 [Pisolithus croceorrhizus]|nr:hypothetical protein EDD16DRAFT_1683384 [Pisolithus croceorrhizus]